MLRKIIFAAAVGVAATAPLPSAEEVLLQDDECVAGDEACALNALQLRGTKPLPGMDIDVGNAPIDTYEDLREAIEATPMGRKIEIMKGAVITFTSTINILKNSTFEIWSEGATFDGQNSFGRIRLFYVMGSLNMHGIVLKNGKTDFAGALYFDFYSHGNISNCNFIGNHATYTGGAIVAKGATLVLENVNFRHNSADNTCPRHKHCTRRRRNARKGNAVYILGKSTVDISMVAQPKSEDFYFDDDFRGSATFHCTEPAMAATTHRILKAHVHHSPDCSLVAPAA